jgi:predicted transcriptional regulator
MARAHADGRMEGARDLRTYRAENEVASVRDLAQQLNRDKEQVSRDLETLARHGVISFETDGRAKKPYLQHEHVAVGPIV